MDEFNDDPDLLYADYFTRDMPEESPAPSPRASIAVPRTTHVTWPLHIFEDRVQRHLLQLAADFNPESFDWEAVRKYGLLYKACLDCRKRNFTSGKILMHAKEQVRILREQIGFDICIFKIGVTADPVLRYKGYVNQGYSAMRLMTLSASADMTNMLEAALVSEFQSEVGCRNKANTGGEGALARSNPPLPPYFTYVVGARADQPRRVG